MAHFCPVGDPRVSLWFLYPFFFHSSVVVCCFFSSTSFPLRLFFFFHGLSPFNSSVEPLFFLPFLHTPFRCKKLGLLPSFFFCLLFFSPITRGPGRFSPSTAFSWWNWLPSHPRCFPYFGVVSYGTLDLVAIFVVFRPPWIHTLKHLFFHSAFFISTGLFYFLFLPPLTNL